MPKKTIDVAGTLVIRPMPMNEVANVMAPEYHTKRRVA
jgi:hypothetical protein